MTYEGKIDILVDFKGELAHYRSIVGSDHTRNAGVTFQSLLTTLNDGQEWGTFVADHLRNVEFDELDTAAVWTRVNEALMEYNRRAARIVLEEEDPRKLQEPDAAGESGEDVQGTHSCVQYVFVDGGWQAIYNYNVYATNVNPKEVVGGVVGRRIPSDLKVRFRAMATIYLRD